MEEFETIPPLSQQQHDSKDSDTPPPKLKRGWAKTWMKANVFATKEARRCSLRPEHSTPT
jgi:hypothetical protein